MAFTTNEHFITRMKLSELQLQRDRMLIAYAALEQAVQAAPNDAEKLRLLYDQLRSLAFAGHAMHPDVANLEPIFQGIASGRTSATTLAFWRDRFMRELSAGQRRAAVVYLFGAILDDWLTRETPGASDAARLLAQRAALEAAWQPSLPGEYHQIFDAFPWPAPIDFIKQMMTLDYSAIEMTYTPQGELYYRLPFGPTIRGEEYEGLRRIGLLNRETLSSLFHLDTIVDRVGMDDLQAILEAIRNDVYRSPTIRSEAVQFLASPLLCQEFADALTIQIAHLETWHWPESGVSAEARWQRTRFRLYLDEDLPTTCLLELLGKRWQEHFSHRFSANESSILSLFRDDTPPTGDKNIHLSPDGASMPNFQGTLWSKPATQRGARGSVFAQRNLQLQQLRSFDHFHNYSGSFAGNGPGMAVAVVNAELQLGRAAFPGRPLFIIKADIQEYYASLSHDVLLDLLTRLGVTEQHLAFFRRFLAIPLRMESGVTVAQSGVTVAQSGVTVAQSGVPVNRHLADLLGELVLRVLDAAIQQAAQVMIVRMVDDICLIATSAEEAVKGWAALKATCEALGLQLNLAKCGAVALAADLPASLPTAPPTWMMVQLDRDGQWQIDAAAAAIYLDQARNQVLSAPSLMDRVKTFNAGATYLQAALLLNLDLGESHRQGVRAVISRFFHAFTDDATGIIDLLRQTLHDEFPEDPTIATLPDAWFVWPITAGGLGLRDIMLETATYLECAEHSAHPSPPATRPDDWQWNDRHWGEYYAALTRTVTPAAPQTNPIMEALANDFIKRGKALSQGKQQSLSTYWRWILYLYGPAIIDHFGTFRFLLTELVPLNLITNRFAADEMDAAGEGS